MSVRNEVRLLVYDGEGRKPERVSTPFLITWHNLHNTSLNEEHAEDSVTSFFLTFVHDLERLHFFPVHSKQQKSLFYNLFETCLN